MAQRFGWRVGPGSPSDGMGETALEREFEGIDSIARRMYVVLPTHPKRLAWDWVLIFAVLYSALTVPMDVCFVFEKVAIAAVIDRLVDVYFVCDIVLNFRTALYNHDGTFEIEPGEIRRRYMRSWFLIDLVASIPFDIFTTNAAGTALSLAKLPRLVRRNGLEPRSVALLLMDQRSSPCGASCASSA